MITHKPPKAYPIPNHEGLFSCYDWHPDMADNILPRMSKSSVMSDFGFCQQQYGIKRVIGMKEPQNDAMVRGTNVHDAYEYILLVWIKNNCEFTSRVALAHQPMLESHRISGI